MRRFFTFLFALATCICYSQFAFSSSVVNVPYSMGFELEDSVEMSNWVLNPGVNALACPDQWYVGNAVKSDGKQSLYISADQGASAVFGVAQNIQYAYRDFVLPKGAYEVSFDWACLGSNEAFLTSLVKLAPKRVVYVSCGPDTLARDLKFLTKKGYKVEAATPYDMFPNTKHVECLCYMLKKN